MKKGILLINLLMVFCIAALAYKLSADWDEWERTHSQESIMERIKVEDPQIQIPLVDLAKSAANQQDVSLIGDQNLFHEDRNMSLPEVKQAAEAEKPALQLRNRPTISGFLQMGDKLTAHVLSNSAEEGASRSMLLAKGDTWEDPWIVEDVKDDRLILVAGESREEILYHDPNKKRAEARRVAPKNAPGPGGEKTSVVTIGSSTPASRPPTATPATRAPERSRTMPNRAASAAALKNRTARDGIESGNRLFGSQRGKDSSNLSRGSRSSGQSRTSPFSRSRSRSTTNSGRR